MHSCFLCFSSLAAAIVVAVVPVVAVVVVFYCINFGFLSPLSSWLIWPLSAAVSRCHRLGFGLML